MKIKICGIRDLAAAKAAEDGGADYIGFIFAPTRRYIDPIKASAIAKEIRRAKKVGVFVDEDIARVNAIAAEAGLDYIQLHGHESPDYARKVCRPVIKAMRWGDDFSPEAAESYPAEFILIDNFSKEKIGGTGEKFAWREAAAACRKLTKPFFVAGGISLDNAAEAKEIFHPFGLDVSGSLETDGAKDRKKIAAFLRAAEALRA